MQSPRPPSFDDPSWSLPDGFVVLERYEIKREIGRGGMGAVFEAFDRTLERPVAVKFLNPDKQTAQKAIERFQLEAVATGRIGHENICDVRDRGVTEDGMAFIVMELLEGESLFQLLHRECRLDPEKAIGIMLTVLDALEAAHDAGIVHRDLKPENIFLARGARGKLRVKLLDFGLSRFLDEKRKIRLTTIGKVVGSPSYMSPEQARGMVDVDHRTDVWAVGVILYQCLTGRRPFAGSNFNEILTAIVTEQPTRPSVVMPGLSDALDAVIMTALAMDRDYRYQSAAEFEDALREVIETRASALRAPTGKICEGEEAGIPTEEISALPQRTEPYVPRAKHARRSKRPARAKPLLTGKTIPLIAGGFLVFVLAGASAWFAVNRLSGTNEDTGSQAAGDETASVTTPITPPPPVPPSGSSEVAPSPTPPAAPTKTLGVPVVQPVQPPPPPSQAVPEPSPPPAGATKIVVRIQAHPPYSKIYLDGERVDDNPYMGDHARDGRSHNVKISASGFDDHEQSLVFDQDHALDIQLERDSRRRR